LPSIQSKDLILLALVKTQMAMVFNRTVRKLACSPDQAALFGALLTHEQHSRGLAAIRAGRLLLMNPTAGKIGAVGDGKPHRSVGLDNVDAAGGDDAKLRIPHHGESAQRGHRKHEREHAGVDGEETGTGQSFHK
jgi:hypothetical protein